MKFLTAPRLVTAMAQQQIQISIPNPCSESWDAMKPIDRLHRHCGSCNRIITDFTQLSEAEISDHLRYNHKPCGRYRNDQLQRIYTVAAPPKTKPRKSTWLLFTSFFLADAVMAQTSPATTTVVAPAKQPVQQKIYGRVIDKASGEALAGAFVGLPDGSHSTECNKKGEFTLTLRQPATELVVYCLGHNRKKITLHPGFMEIRLEAETATLNEVVIEAEHMMLRERDHPISMGIEAPTFTSGPNVITTETAKKRPLRDFFRKLKNSLRKKDEA